LIRACRKSSETPSRTLSRLSVLWPMITASASERCRNRNCLSSREVKSTGVKSRVVIFPSTVIAKVALTNGRSGLVRDDVNLRTGLARTLLRLRDFMLGRGNFAFHFAQAHPFRDAAGSIEEINDAARGG
jgi:hypothetical protein